MEITQATETKKPQVRLLKEMNKVVFDKNFAKKHPNLELYYISRGVKRNDSLRYDITIIPARMLGEEFVRTKGNCNSEKFPELYTVLEGEAIFLMQKTKGDIVEQVISIQAKKGHWIIIPPEYAVIMINHSKKTLKTANWVSEKNKNIYEELEKMEGPCYFYTQSGWVKNKNYKKIPPIDSKNPLKERPKNLDFLR